MNSVKNKNVTIWIKGIIFLIVLLMVIHTIHRNVNFNKNYFESFQEVFLDKFYIFCAVFLLIPLNLFLEAVKWKYLIRKIENISYTQAFEGVLAGVSIGFITPHSIGDYAARILTLENSERLKGIGTVFLCRISQFYSTLYFGTVALVFYLLKVAQLDTPDYLDVLFYFLVVNNVVFTLVYIFHKRILRWLDHVTSLRKLLFYFELIRTYSFKEINGVFFLSLLRYLVFSTQFILLLYAFGIALPIGWMFMGVSFVFLVKSIIPTFFDLGIREGAALLFFGSFGFENEPILYASLTIWLCNIVLPALLGLTVVMKLKLAKN